MSGWGDDGNVWNPWRWEGLRNEVVKCIAVKCSSGAEMLLLILPTQSATRWSFLPFTKGPRRCLGQYAISRWFAKWH